MDIFYVLNFLMGLFGLFMIGLTYTYIDKMEKTGCACAEYKYRKFIKVWTVIAFFVVAVIMFVPVKLVHDFNKQLGQAYVLFHFLFVAVHIVYLIMCLMYINHLVREKCKCSDDSRRELLYIWFIFRAILLLALVVLPLFIKLGMTSIAEIEKSGDSIMKSSTVPSTKDFKKIPKSLRSSMKALKKSSKK
jgi:hypothetical protein